VPNKHNVLSLETHDALLASNKLLSDKIETLAKKSEAELAINGVSYKFCEQAHECGACLPASLVHAFLVILSLLTIFSQTA
jgi:hypothetical protein